MKILKKEIIKLSADEENAFNLVSDTLEEIARTVDDPAVSDQAADLNRFLCDFCCDYCEEF